MLHFSRRSLSLRLLLLTLAALSLAAVGARAQNSSGAAKDKDAPPFHEYKGVQVGMTTEEARKKLGNPADKSDTNDYYSFSEGETAQLYYDASHKVTAIVIMYTGDVAKAPTAKAVLGSDIEAKPDGPIYKKLDFPKAGYWVAYSRTSGDSPFVTITIQKQQ